MQRVRIGLTGLAFVFLAVLLAAVFTRNPTREAPITPNLLEQQKALGRRSGLVNGEAAIIRRYRVIRGRSPNRVSLPLSFRSRSRSYR